jgi:hypothetical protein
LSSITVGAHSRPAPNRWNQACKALASWRTAAARTASAAAGRVATMRQAALTVTGLGLVDAAAYQVTTGVGLLATGASVLVLEWLTND